MCSISINNLYSFPRVKNDVKVHIPLGLNDVFMISSVSLKFLLIDF